MENQKLREEICFQRMKNHWNEESLNYKILQQSFSLKEIHSEILSQTLGKSKR